jgi:hypothetical protein
MCLNWFPPSNMTIIFGKIKDQMLISINNYTSPSVSKRKTIRYHLCIRKFLLYGRQVLIFIPFGDISPSYILVVTIFVALKRRSIIHFAFFIDLSYFIMYSIWLNEYTRYSRYYSFCNFLHEIWSRYKMLIYEYDI